MGIVAFPHARRVAIEHPREISALESLIAALAAFVDATGGAIALDGRDLAALPLRARIRLLGEMYAAGCVAMTWRDGRDDRRFAATIEKRDSPRSGACWRVDVRTADDAPAAPVDALSAPDLDTVARDLVRALAGGFDRGRRPGDSRVSHFAR